MRRSNLDTVARKWLLNRGYPLHFYVQTLAYMSDCLREMAMDDLRVINSVELTLTNYKAVAIPCDYLSMGLIGPKNGQYIKPITKTKNLNRSYNYDTNGIPQIYPAVEDSQQVLATLGVPMLAWYINSYNSRGENIGGLYGYRSDGSPYTYQVFEERNEIQLDVDYGFPTVCLQYVSDGRTSNAATSVDTLSEKCLEDYASYAYAENKRDTPANERERLYQKYVRSREVFRARKNVDEMGIDDLLNFVIYKNYSASPKI